MNIKVFITLFLFMIVVTSIMAKDISCDFCKGFTFPDYTYDTSLYNFCFIARFVNGSGNLKFSE